MRCIWEEGEGGEYPVQQVPPKFASHPADWTKPSAAMEKGCAPAAPPPRSSHSASFVMPSAKPGPEAVPACQEEEKESGAPTVWAEAEDGGEMARDGGAGGGSRKRRCELGWLESEEAVEEVGRMVGRAEFLLEKEEEEEDVGLNCTIARQDEKERKCDDGNAISIKEACKANAVERGGGEACPSYITFARSRTRSKRGENAEHTTQRRWRRGMRGTQKKRPPIGHHCWRAFLIAHTPPSSQKDARKGARNRASAACHT